MSESSGWTYTGEFKGGEKEGEGVEKLPNGNTYTGQYMKDQKEGNGIMQWYGIIYIYIYIYLG